MFGNVVVAGQEKYRCFSSRWRLRVYVMNVDRSNPPTWVPGAFLTGVGDQASVYMYEIEQEIADQNLSDTQHKNMQKRLFLHRGSFLASRPISAARSCTCGRPPTPSGCSRCDDQTQHRVVRGASSSRWHDNFRCPTGARPASESWPPLAQL
jgi:hypothetical protein